MNGLRAQDTVPLGDYWDKEASLAAQTVKNLPAMQVTWAQSLGREDPLEKGMATCLENPMDRGTWWATVHGVTELDMTG